LVVFTFKVSSTKLRYMKHEVVIQRGQKDIHYIDIHASPNVRTATYELVADASEDQRQTPNGEMSGTVIAGLPFTYNHATEIYGVPPINLAEFGIDMTGLAIQGTQFDALVVPQILRGAIAQFVEARKAMKDIKTRYVHIVIPVAASFYSEKLFRKYSINLQREEAVSVMVTPEKFLEMVPELEEMLRVMGELGLNIQSIEISKSARKPIPPFSHLSDAVVTLQLHCRHGEVPFHPVAHAKELRPRNGLAPVYDAAQPLLSELQPPVPDNTAQKH
jgi:hypothetical protein